MITLGIESTAHTFGIGVVENGKVLSNEMDIFRPEKGEGIIPRKAADHHAQLFSSVLESSLKKSRKKIEEINLISFAQGPGIGAPLKIGLVGAKYLALKYRKDIIGVNHPFAHIKISEGLSGVKQPLILYISGGNTQILIEKKPFEFQVLGETFDIGVGNLFDNFARKIGLGNGKDVEDIAKKGRYIELPYTVKGMNLTFSGLLTYCEGLIGKEKNEDIAYSLMETSFSELCEAVERALFLTKRNGIIVCGGVAQNKRIQEMLGVLCKEDGVEFGVAPNEFNRDNGAMIAYAAEILYKKFGKGNLRKLESIQDYRVDMIKEVMKKY